MNRALVLAVLSTVPAVASAQVVTPVPPKSTPAPAWTPPPVAPPAPQPPAEPDVPTPNIVKLDAAGFVIWPDKPYEIVVFEALPIDAQQRQTWEAKLKERRAQLDDLILRNLGEALSIRESLYGIDAVDDWGPLVKLATPLNNFFAVKPPLDQFVRTSQILRAKQLNAFNDGVKHFKAQSTDSLMRRIGNDQAKLMVEKPREAAKERALEGMLAFDRMTTALADNWASVKASTGVSGDFAAAEAMVASAKDPAAKAAAGFALLKAIPAERRAEVLGAFRTPMPPAPKPPSDPAIEGAPLPKTPGTPLPPAGTGVSPANTPK
ncbi:MAG TPA: hypothetical protein VEB22_00740 [Phycisphaerales bacterium]|nr:hypothetical protein [Phycisphaerales bacterium]